MQAQLQQHLVAAASAFHMFAFDFTESVHVSAEGCSPFACFSVCLSVCLSAWPKKRHPLNNNPEVL